MTAARSRERAADPEAQAMFRVALTAAGFLTGYLGFVLIMPWLAYSAWHAYRATLKPEPWPVQPDLTD